MRREALMTEGLKSFGALLVVFCLLEALLRVTYLIRDSLVEYVPIPYVLEGDYGPVPPWVDGLRQLEADATLNLHYQMVIATGVWSRQQIEATYSR